MTTKKKVGFYGLTGCAGCLLSVIFDEVLDIINAVDIVSFPFIKGKNSDERLDICFVEGTVVSEDDLEILNKLRLRSSTLVSLGACASHGNIPALRNYHDKSTRYLKYKKKILDVEEPGPLHNFVKIDYHIPGCPPDGEEIRTFVKEILLGKKFRNYPDPVCRECRLEEQGCLLDEDKICLGPLIKGGCKAVCPDNGLECYGCRGLTDDTNFEEYFELLESKGIKTIEIKKRMETFIGLEVNEKLKGSKWEKLH